MMTRINNTHHAVSEVISTLLLLIISIFGATILAIFINNFFDAGIFSQTNLNNPQNLFLIGYDARDGSNLFGISSIDNSCGTGTSCTLINLDGGSEFIVLALENRGVSDIHINNVFLDEFQHSWDSSTIDHNLDTLPSAGKFSMIKSLTSPTQIAPDIQAGKIGYLIIKLDSGLKFENLQLVNMRIDEKGIDSQRFIIRIGMAA